MFTFPSEWAVEERANARKREVAHIHVNEHHSEHICIWTRMRECLGGRMFKRLNADYLHAIHCSLQFGSNEMVFEMHQMWTKVSFLIKQLKIHISGQAEYLLLVGIFVLQICIEWMGRNSWHTISKVNIQYKSNAQNTCLRRLKIILCYRDDWQ